MKKTIKAALLSFALCIALIPPAAWAESSGIGANLSSGSSTVQDEPAYCLDEYGVFTSDQKASLNQQAASLSDQYGIGVYILFTDDLNGMSAQSFSEGYYNSKGLGLGDDKNGIILIVAVNSRDWIIVGHGTGANDTEFPGGRLTDSRREAIGKRVAEELGAGDWYGGASTYVRDIGETFAYYEKNGKAMVEMDWGRVLGAVGIAIVVALIVAFGVVKANVNAMKTARAKSEAGDYVQRETFQLTSSSDHFVSTHTTVVRRPKSSSGGGGSSWSGGGFSGSSGKF